MSVCTMYTYITLTAAALLLFVSPTSGRKFSCEIITEMMMMNDDSDVSSRNEKNIFKRLAHCKMGDKLMDIDGDIDSLNGNEGVLTGDVVEINGEEDPKTHKLKVKKYKLMKRLAEFRKNKNGGRMRKATGTRSAVAFIMRVENNGTFLGDMKTIAQRDTGAQRAHDNLFGVGYSGQNHATAWNSCSGNQLTLATDTDGEQNDFPGDQTDIFYVDVPSICTSGQLYCQRTYNMETSCGTSEYYGMVEYVYNYLDTNKPYPSYSRFAWQHKVFIFSSGSGVACNFVGLGNTACSSSYCNSWIPYKYANRAQDYTHEMGHNLGLAHGGNNLYSSGNSREYGDSSCAMGFCCTTRCYNAPHNVELGWTTPQAALDVATMTGPTAIALDSLSAVPLTGTVSIKVGSNTYYVQYKTSDSYDVYMSSSWRNNVQIKRWNGGGYELTLHYVTLTSGGSWTDPSGQVVVSVTSIDSTNKKANIVVGPPSTITATITNTQTAPATVTNTITATQTTTITATTTKTETQTTTKTITTLTITDTETDTETTTNTPSPPPPVTTTITATETATTTITATETATTTITATQTGTETHTATTTTKTVTATDTATTTKTATTITVTDTTTQTGTTTITATTTKTDTETTTKTATVTDTETTTKTETTTEGAATITTTVTTTALLSSSDCTALGWQSKGCICGESDAWTGGCSGVKTHAEAVSFCSARGGRLCSKAELKTDVTAGTGCQYDNELIWTSTSSGCSAGQFWQVPGRLDRNVGSDTCAPATNTQYVRCCADFTQAGSVTVTAAPKTVSTKNCTTLGNNWRLQGDACGESDVPQCNNDKTFYEAQSICENIGARLCTSAELRANTARGTGCGYDNKYVWTQTTCTVNNEQGYLVQRGRGSATSSLPDTCVTDLVARSCQSSLNVNVRCCGDVSV
eukprot:m.340411 g.340411  ORF g.340411 m.340411 type:complete len:924 (+) comp19286_c0_seq1:195-2966(+)